MSWAMSFTLSLSLSSSVSLESLESLICEYRFLLLFVFFTGASASIKGYPKSSPFAISKFGLRGLAQSLARELAPKNIHVAHFVIDGGISTGDADPRNINGKKDALLEPDAIADTYFQVLQQHRSAWSWEVEVRPWCENF